MDKLMVILADLFLGNFKSQSPVAKFLTKCADMYHLAIDEIFASLNDMFVYIQENKKDFEKICFHWTPVYLSIKSAWRETSPELKKHYLGIYNVLDIDARMQNHPDAAKIQESITPILNEFNDIFEWNTPETKEEKEEPIPADEEGYESSLISMLFEKKALIIQESTADDIINELGRPVRISNSITKAHSYNYLYYVGTQKEIQFCLVDGILDEVRY